MSRISTFLRAVFLSPLDGWREALRDIQSIVDNDYRTLHPSPVKSLLLFAVPLFIGWVVYVPIHELLHVAGAVLTGVQDFRLEIDALYGGHLLARLLPSHIIVGSEYAGRLVDFHPPSDLSYLVLVAAPYLLTLPGVPLLRRTVRTSGLILLGPAALLALAPFLNLWGDLNELGTILSTRAYALATGRSAEGFEALRRSSDDLFRTLRDLESLAPDVPAASRWLLALGGFFLGLIAAGLMYRTAALLAPRAPEESRDPIPRAED